MSSTNTKKINALKIIIGTCIAVLIAVLLFLLLRGSTTVTKTEVSNEQTSSLICKSGSANGAYYTTSVAPTSFSQEARATYAGDELQNLFYIYSGEYTNESDAKTATTEVHAAYNTYTGQHNLDQDVLQATYNNIDTTSKVTFYAEKKNITYLTARLLAIDINEGASTVDTSLSSLKSNYIKQGFSCSVDE